MTPEPDEKERVKLQASNGGADGMGTDGHPVNADGSVDLALHAMFGQAGVGVCLINGEFLFAQVNSRLCEIVGRSELELIGRSCLDICHEDDREENYRILQQLLETETETARFETRTIRTDGSTVWVRINLSKITGRATTTPEFVAVVEDIDQQKHAEQRLRESEQRFARFMQNLPGLAWIKDSEGRYVFVNDAAEQAFGIHTEKLYGLTDAEVFPPETAAAFIENDRKAMDSDTVVQVVEVLETDSGDLVESLVSKFTIPTDFGQPQLVGGMAIDITDQRRALRDQEFLFVIAEKIRTATQAQDLLPDVARLIGEYLGVHRCLFNEIDLESDTEIVHSDFARDGDSVAGVHRISDYSSITSEVMGSGRTVVNVDSAKDPRTAEFYSKIYEVSKERAYVAVPLMRDGRWVASLWCSNDRPRNWTDGEVSLLENIAERTWVAVERLRTEAALRDNEEMFSAIVGNAPFGVYMIDSDFRLRSINKGSESVFAGIDPLIGRDFAEILRIVWDEPFASEAIGRFRHTLATGESFVSLPIIEQRANLDEIQAYDWQIHRVTLPGGSHGVVCYFYDLTYQKKLEEVARRSAEIDAYRLKLADALRNLSNPREVKAESVKVLGEHLDATRVAYCEISDDGYYTVEHDFSPEVPPLTGRYSVALFGKNVLRAYSAGHVVRSSDIETEADLSEPEREVYRDAGVASFVGVPLIKDKRLVSVLAVHHGQPREWTPVEIELVTETAERTWAAVERARAEEALRESEEKFRTLFESIDEGLAIVEIILDEGGRPVDYLFVEFNPSFPALTGLPADALGKTARQLLPDLEDFWFETYGKVALTGESVRFENGSDVMGRWFDVYASRVGDFPSLRVAIVFSDISEGKVAEKALRESEARFRNMADHAPVMIWVTDPQSYCTYRSQSWYEFTGQTAETGLGLGWLNAVHPADRDHADQEFRVAHDQRRPFLIEYRVRHSEGSYRWAIDSAQPRFGESGEFLGYIGSVIDITTRKEAEEKLRESEERFQLAQSAGNVGVWDWDITAGETYWSDTMWRFYGEAERSLNPDDAFWSAHLHPEDRDRVKEHLRATIESSEVQYKDEFRIIGTGGRTIWIDSMAQIVRGLNGEAIRAYGVNLDITERKLIEERIRRNETQLRLVTDSLPALIAYIDRDKRYRFVNRTYSDWFGEAQEALIGRELKDVLGESAYRSIEPLIEKALGGEPVSLHTEIDYRKAGQKFIHVNYVPDVADDGSVRGFFSLISDLTEIRRSEELLRSTEERMAQLVENVADYAIFSIDPKGIIESWNTGAEKIFGYTAEEALGSNSDMLFTTEDLAKGVPLNEMRVARQKGRATDERWYVRKGGERFFANMVAMPLMVGKDLTGYARIASDLTEKKRQAEALQSAHDELELRVFQRTRELGETNELLRREVEQRKLSEEHRVKLLHRIVSAQEAERKRIARDIHDQFGQRLTALRLKLASLRDICGDNEIVAKRVERLQEIAMLLDSEVSFLASELRPSILDDLGLEDALRAYAGEWATHFDIELKFHSNGVVGRRFGREAETQVYRIAQEALNNVAKHAGAAEVTMLLEQTADFLVLVIEDGGSGFTVTDKFLRTKKGLGLVGMKERATLIGAELEIESAPGEGTTVFLRLPTRKRGKRNGK